MHNFTLFTFVVLGFIASVSLAASAAPPACVLACVNKEKNPGDLAAVCASSSVGTCLNTQCDDYKDQAIQAFKTTCKASGHDADVGPPSSSESSSMTKTESSSGKTSEATATGTAISFTTASASGSMPTGSGTHASNSSKPTSPSSPTGTEPPSSDGTHIILSSFLCILAVAVSAATL